MKNFTAYYIKFLNMYLSNYNVSKTIEKDTWVYNTLTQGFIKLSTQEWIDLISSVSHMTLEPTHPLCQTGIVVNSKEEQILSYKYAYYANMFKNKSLFLYIAPSMDCNLNCFYCFEKNNKYAGNMSEDVINRLIEYVDLSKKDINIVWFGGEPMLGYNQIIDICNKLSEREIKFTSSMITNGTLLTPHRLKDLNKLNLKFIQISLDGIGSMHDKRRMFKNGKPSFNLIMQNLSVCLSTTDIPIVLQVTVDKSNREAYEEVVGYIKQKFAIHYFSGRIRVAKNYVQNRTDFDSAGSCYSNSEIVEDQTALLCSGCDNTIDLPCLSMPCMFRCSDCYAIDPKGDIYKCIEHLGNKDYRIGSIKEGRVVIPQLASCAFLDDPFLSNQCIECNVFPICGGGCPVDHIKYRNGEINSYCSKYKDTIQELLPNLYNIKYNQK